MDNTNKNINQNANTNENKKINNKRGSEYKEQLEKLKDKKYIKELEKQGIKVVSVNDRDYPAKLLPYNHRPEYLFYKGRLPDRDKPVVAMVGARACSNYGRKMARALARELSENGVQIISGMARGIDTYSQIGALEGGTPTFAVLGSGVDVCYPTENIELYNDILKNGGIISEYPPGAGPIAWHFPLRNRIISGLSDKVIVVEAREKSGSLITVEWALEQGKDVMAVPGRVGEKLSDGCNCLIRAGAGIITGANDVLNDIQYSGSKNENEKKQKEKSESCYKQILKSNYKNTFILSDKSAIIPLCFFRNSHIFILDSGFCNISGDSSTKVTTFSNSFVSLTLVANICMKNTLFSLSSNRISISFRNSSPLIFANLSSLIIVLSF